VQTRASLISGDDVALSVTVGEGASLELVELGAMLAHNVRTGPEALMRSEIRVASGGRFIWLSKPLIIAAGANARRTTTVDLAASACALVGDAIVLGRAREDPGALLARTRIAYDGRTAVDETLDTRDRATLRSAVVAGDARMIFSLTLAGTRDQTSGAETMQAHGPATLWRSTGKTAAAGQELDDLAGRWRTLVLRPA
jgi:urease accessory protein